MFSTRFLDIAPLQGVNGALRLPGSKSISNRLLLLSALSRGSTQLHDLLDSDDTRVMLTAMEVLGCVVARNGQTVRIVGQGGRLPVQKAKLFLGNAGTAMRPLTAALAVLGGDYELAGVPRMHERPIRDLVDALRQLGCRIDYLGSDGYPPLRIGTPQLRLDQPIHVRGDVSSQFLTALLMALPLVARQDITIVVDGELISRPYIEITLNLLARFGVQVRRDGWQRFVIPAGCSLRSPGKVHVEADASSASYFIAMGAIAARAGQAVRIQGVGADSIQGDIRFIGAAALMGARVQSGPNWLQVDREPALADQPLRAIDLDCNHMPDAAMTLAVMALYADAPSTLRNIASWRVKETDRIAAMATELRKFGALVDEGPDFIRVTPPDGAANWRAASIHTYDDHRIAMCCSLAAFNPAGLPVRILDPQCVGKTFPDYFETMFSVAQTPASRIPVLCVDGPTASGKGTLAAELARQLGFHFLDSGALYRLTALAATRAGITLDAAGEPTIVALVQRMDIRFLPGQVFLGGEAVTELLRTEEMGMNASRVSVLPRVRQALIGLQHATRRLPGLVADGRDMGTVIFPDAPLKVFLTASAARRAE
ncbi:MAG: bifunctional 3-phosphoshikimate 1-carboxyvinyltransferase/cytidylate kinase, partial [Burkholderiaceae bacterium]